ncbi:hypothetical protein [Baaleninema simplex]|nr:hypothetical protein [Baaleninema simplex]
MKAISTLDLTVPLAVSGQHLRHQLSFEPPVGWEEAIERTISAEENTES